MENANPFGKFLTFLSQNGYEPSVKLEEAVARLTDTIDLQTQHNKQVEQKLSNLQNFMNQPKQFNSGGYAAQPEYNRGLVPASNPLYQPSLSVRHQIINQQSDEPTLEHWMQLDH